MISEATPFYLNAIEKPPRLLRPAPTTYYRIDHVDAVPREVAQQVRGNFSTPRVLERRRHAFTKTPYAMRDLGLARAGTVH